jgi:signal transduction histidine kinase
LAVTVEDDRQPKPLDDAMRLVLFEAVRELLVNVVKHADTGACTVSIRRGGAGVQIAVTDSGRGPGSRAEPAGAGGDGERDRERRPAGFGLFNIRERLERLGGNLVIRALPERGTEVILSAPLKTDALHGSPSITGSLAASLSQAPPSQAGPPIEDPPNV